MGHNHGVFDSDTRFVINPTTRQIRNESSRKTTVIQFDHNSERFTFECPRYIEGHDMSVCNKVEIHYINIDPKTKQQNTGLYVSDDLKVSPEDETKVVCSWLISQNATQIIGALNFIVCYKCIENNECVYAWNTAISSVSVSDGINASESVATEYADVLEQWKAELYNAGYINASTMQAEVNTLKSRMDSFVALKDGSTTGDAELIDIRVGANGTIYPSAGTAVRCQTNQLSDAINKIMIENIYDPSVQTEETITDNHFIQSGKLISNENYFVTAPIDVSRFAGRNLYFNVLLHGYATDSAAVSCFDADGNFLTEHGRNGNCYTVPYDANYIRLTVYKYSYWDIEDVNNAFMILTADVDIDFFPCGIKFLIPKEEQTSNCKMAIDVRDGKLNFTAPSGTKYLHYNMQHFTGSKNAFFDFAKIAEAKEMSAFPTEETVVFSNGSDFFAPYIVKATNNADGDAPDSLNFTGASHAYSGNTEGTSSATGRSVVTSILVDGVSRDAYSGYCNTLDVFWTNYIQATNTKKEDGTGREVLKEEYHLHFDGSTFEIENDITALEDVEILRYYGLQIAQGVPNYSYNVSYVGSHKNIVSAQGNSKSSDTQCKEIYIKRLDASVECRFGVYPVGLGTFYCNNWYSAFDTDYGKSYMFLICPDKSCAMTENQQVNFKGYYKFRYCE